MEKKDKVRENASRHTFLEEGKMDTFLGEDCRNYENNTGEFCDWEVKDIQNQKEFEF